MAILVLAAPLAVAQTPKTEGSRGVPAVVPQAAPGPIEIPGGDLVVATVNDAKITKADVIRLLGQYSIPTGRDEEVYQSAVQALVNRELLSQFLDKQGVRVTEPEIDAELAKLRSGLKESDQGDLDTMLAGMNLSAEAFRKQMQLGLRWNKHVKREATDQALRDYFQKNVDLFAGTQIKASHILIKVDPDASDEVKQAAKQKLLDIKKQIEDGELSFAQAANKYSEDDANRETPDGGNLDYFAKRGNYIESFCDAAFGLEAGKISDPVETEFGYHLILVTDRQKGQEVSYDQLKPQVEQIFGSELQQDSIEAIRKEAKITVEPMPEGFFPPPASATPIPARTQPASPNR